MNALGDRTWSDKSLAAAAGFTHEVTEASRCPTCRMNLAVGTFVILEHGCQFDTFDCLAVYEEKNPQLLPPKPLLDFSVVIKVRATDCRHAVDVASERLNTGGEPDAVLTCPITFPDPDMEGQTVTL